MFAYIRNNEVIELLPDFDPALPGIEIERRYPAEFLTSCITVDDTVQVGYLKTEFGFEEPKIISNPVFLSKNNVEDLRTNKLEYLKSACTKTILNGVDVKLSRRMKHFSLSTNDQINLNAMSVQAKSGQTSFLYHADGEETSEYTAEEIIEVANAASSWITANTTYFGLLKKWANRETDVANIEAIQYGSKLPADLMKELKTLLSTVGIDSKILKLTGTNARKLQ